MSRLSIRERLAVGMVVLVAVTLGAVDLSGVLLLRSYLLQRVDSQVSAIGPPAHRSALPQGSPRPSCANPRDPQGLRTDFVILILGRGGRVVCSLGPHLGGAGPDLSYLGRSAGSAAANGSQRLVTVPSLNGSGRWRVKSVAAPHDRTLVLAVSLAEADATVARMTRLTVVVSSIVLLLTAIGAWLVAAFGLRPLRRIEDTADHIAQGDLTQRVPGFRPRTEVGRLARSLNGMLAQIEAAFTVRTDSEARLRRFVSDASHELRTPVATIRGHAELWRLGARDDLDATMNRIESEAKRLGTLVDDMLMLARLDSSRPLQRHEVDLGRIATDAVVDARATQPERTVRLDVHTDGRPAIMQGDEARLRQVLANLVTNALWHTPVTSTVAVRIETTASLVRIAVADEGPGMPERVAARVFDRFYRAEPARASGHGGAGLGLSIVKSLVEAHHGTISCVSTVAGGSTFTITLRRDPCWDTPGDHAEHQVEEADSSAAGPISDPAP